MCVRDGGGGEICSSVKFFVSNVLPKKNSFPIFSPQAVSHFASGKIWAVASRVVM